MITTTALPAKDGLDRLRLLGDDTGAYWFGAETFDRHDDAADWYAPGADAERACSHELVFTPSRHIAILWRSGVEWWRRELSAAHGVAWRDSLTWLESQVLDDGPGAADDRADTSGSPAPQAPCGLVALVADHPHPCERYSDPHTHVLLSSRVRRAGRWTDVDPKRLARAVEGAATRYRTLLETDANRRRAAASSEMVPPLP